MVDRVTLLDTIAAFTAIHAIIIRELDQAGSLSQDSVVAQLRQYISNLEASPIETGPASAALARGLIGMLEGPAPSGWTPRVIEGDG